MARRTRPGEWATLYVEVPPELKEWLDAQAVANRRSMTAELIMLLERGLDPQYKPATPDKPAKGKAKK
jgi:hypothetical protein